MEKLPIRQNYAILVGYSKIRSVSGASRGKPPTAAASEKIMKLAGEAIRDGAYGISTGYIPSYVLTEELINVSRAVSEIGGIYTSHIRSESDKMLEAVREVISIAEATGISAEISHIKLWGKFNWGKSKEALGLIDEARQRGLDINADCYPYTASAGLVYGTVPPNVREWISARGGISAIKSDEDVSFVLDGIRAQIERIGGADRILLNSMKGPHELGGWNSKLLEE